jgi:hypothetical protein
MPPADQPPPNEMGPDLGQGWMSAASLPAAGWQTPALVEDAQGGGHKGHDLALAGLVCLFALDRTWINTLQAPASTRTRGRRRFERKDDDRE